MKTQRYVQILVGLGLFLSVQMSAAADPRAEEQSFSAKVSDVRLSADLMAQGKQPEDQVTVVVGAKMFDPAVDIKDVRTAGKLPVPEIDFLKNYFKANISGSAEEMLAYWHPSDRAEKETMMADPAMLKANRGMFERNPGFVVRGLVFQEGTTAVLVKRGRFSFFFSLIKSGDGFLLTDRPGNDLELAVIEAALR